MTLRQRLGRLEVDAEKRIHEEYARRLRAMSDDELEAECCRVFNVESIEELRPVIDAWSAEQDRLTERRARR